MLLSPTVILLMDLYEIRGGRLGVIAEEAELQEVQPDLSSMQPPPKTRFQTEDDKLPSRNPFHLNSTSKAFLPPQGQMTDVMMCLGKKGLS